MCALEFAVPLVDSDLGASVIYEEWKGNLAADATAAAGLERARASGARPEVADALLAQGVVHVLRGRPRKAVEHLADVERVAPGDTGRLARALSYNGLARYLDVNCFPGLTGMAGAEFEARSAGFIEEIGARSARLGALLPATGPEVGFESALVNGLLCNLLSVRSAGDDPEILSADRIQCVLQASLAVPDQFAARAAQAGAAPRYLAFAYLAAAGMSSSTVSASPASERSAVAAAREVRTTGPTRRATSPAPGWWAAGAPRTTRGTGRRSSWWGPPGDQPVGRLGGWPVEGVPARMPLGVLGELRTAPTWPRREADA